MRRDHPSRAAIASSPSIRHDPGRRRARKTRPGISTGGSAAPASRHLMTLDNLALIVVAGVLATYAHIMVALWADRFGLPKIDLSMGMADLCFGESMGGKPPYWMGFFVIHLNGVIFALVYATEVAQYLPGPGVVKGIIWGAILWVGAMFIFVPVFFRDGLFGVKLHRMAWATAAIIHGVYGAIVGWLCPVL